MIHFLSSACVCVCDCLFVCSFVRSFVRLFVCCFAGLLVCLFACLLVCLFACLLVCLFACLLVCLFVCLFLFVFVCFCLYLQFKLQNLRVLGCSPKISGTGPVLCRCRCQPPIFNFPATGPMPQGRTLCHWHKTFKFCPFRLLQSHVSTSYVWCLHGRFSRFHFVASTILRNMTCWCASKLRQQQRPDYTWIIIYKYL